MRRLFVELFRSFPTTVNAQDTADAADHKGAQNLKAEPFPESPAGVSTQGRADEYTKLSHTQRFRLSAPSGDYQVSKETIITNIAAEKLDAM